LVFGFFVFGKREVNILAGEQKTYSPLANGFFMLTSGYPGRIYNPAGSSEIQNSKVGFSLLNFGSLRFT